MSDVALHQGLVIDGRYVVEEMIGEGGMAAVYRVRHMHLDTLHALKILTMTSKSVRRRLMQEGRVHAGPPRWQTLGWRSSSLATAAR